MSERWPVTMNVQRADGSSENVVVGSAVKQGDGFRVTLFEMNIQAEGAAMSATRAPARSAASRPAGGGSEVSIFPNYGRSKGQPISGATQQDLEFYANGARRSLSDPGKARFHDKERALLAAIDAELERQGLGGGRGMPDDGDVPPPGDEDAPF